MILVLHSETTVSLFALKKGQNNTSSFCSLSLLFPEDFKGKSKA